MYIMKGLKEWYQSSPQTDEFTKVYDYYNNLLVDLNQPNCEPRGIILPIEMNISLDVV